MDLNPNEILTAQLPKATLINGELSMRFYGDKTGITYVVKTSQDLKTWTEDNVTLSEPDVDGFRTAILNQGGTSGFLRFEVISN